MDQNPYTVLFVSLLRRLSDGLIVAAGDTYLLPKILECVEAHVTIGEISHALRKVWGEYHEAVTV